jgi:large subunit ribosomal protein L9
MKVILLKDVPKLGQAGEVKEVKNGYAQSMLIPNGLAEMATDKKIEAIEKNREEAEAVSAEQEKKVIDSIKSLDGKKITLKLPVNEKGHLYSQVTVANIKDAIQKEAGDNLPESAILLDANIKEAGEHNIKLKHSRVTANIMLQIEKKED